MVRYTKAQVEEGARQWLSGAIKQSDMTTKEWFAMKRRINRAGFKKLPEHYKASTKGFVCIKPPVGLTDLIADSVTTGSTSADLVEILGNTPTDSDLLTGEWDFSTTRPSQCCRD